MLSTVCLGGCASATSENPFRENWAVHAVILRVESRHNYNVSVYVNATGRRELVGEVRANSRDFFEFNYPESRALMLELESEIGETYRLPGTLFPGGGRVELVVGRNLRQSDYIRRVPSEE